MLPLLTTAILLSSTSYFGEFNLPPLGSQALCGYLYTLAFLLAWWQSCARMRLEANCSAQLTPIFRNAVIQRPLVQFPRILAISYALRAGWFLTHTSGVLPNDPHCVAHTVADDCGNVVFSAASRLSQFLFFVSFTVIGTRHVTSRHVAPRYSSAGCRGYAAPWLCVRKCSHS